MLGEFLILETGWYIFNSNVPSEETTYPTFGRGQSSSKVLGRGHDIYVSSNGSIFTIPNFSKSEKLVLEESLPQVPFCWDESGDVSTQVMQNILRREGGGSKRRGSLGTLWFLREHQGTIGKIGDANT